MTMDSVRLFAVVAKKPVDVAGLGRSRNRLDEPAKPLIALFCLELGIAANPLTLAFIAWDIENGSCLVCSFVHLIAVGNSDLMSNVIAIVTVSFHPVWSQSDDLGLNKVVRANDRPELAHCDHEGAIF